MMSVQEKNNALKATEFKWYSVKVTPSSEKKVINYIESQSKKYPDHIGRSFTPIQKEYKMVGKKNVITEKKIMAGYVFLELNPNSTIAFGIIKNMPNVVNFLGGNKTPAPINDEEIERLVGNRKDSPQMVWKLNDWCTINNGPFKGFKGKINNILGEKIIVSVNIFGRETKVETTIESIDKIVS
ncbi:MAG: transcription termination/antitermination protein NusG [Candidatus Woesearchaeota archaeon]